MPRRRQEGGRAADDGLSPPRLRAYSHPDLQHLWSPHGGKRRQGGIKLHPAGDQKRRHPCHRRRFAEPLFLPVSDLVDGMIRMLECDGLMGPVNIGNPVENTILDIANKSMS